MCQNWNDGLEVFEPFIETMNELVVTTLKNWRRRKN